jgi:hypothetical protein
LIDLFCWKLNRAEQPITGIRHWLSCFLLLLFAACQGCGGGGGVTEKLVPVSGMIQLDGRPSAGVGLSFMPAPGTKAVGGCWGVTDAEGKFKVIHLSNKEGIPPGKYHVLFSRKVKSDGTPLGANESPTMTQSQESIAKMYSDPAKVGLHNLADIPAKGTTNLDFKISGAPLKKK